MASAIRRATVTRISRSALPTLQPTLTRQSSLLNLSFRRRIYSTIGFFRRNVSNVHVRRVSRQEIQAQVENNNILIQMDDLPNNCGQSTLSTYLSNRSRVGPSENMSNITTKTIDSSNKNLQKQNEICQIQQRTCFILMAIVLVLAAIGTTVGLVTVANIGTDKPSANSIQLTTTSTATTTTTTSTTTTSTATTTTTTVTTTTSTATTTTSTATTTTTTATTTTTTATTTTSTATTTTTTATTTTSTATTTTSTVTTTTTTVTTTTVTTTTSTETTTTTTETTTTTTVTTTTSTETSTTSTVQTVAVTSENTTYSSSTTTLIADTTEISVNAVNSTTTLLADTTETSVNATNSTTTVVSIISSEVVTSVSNSTFELQTNTTSKSSTTTDTTVTDSVTVSQTMNNQNMIVTSEVAIISKEITTEGQSFDISTVTTVANIQSSTTYDFSKTSKLRSFGDVLCIFFILLISKLFKTISLFLTYDLLKSSHVLFILFLLTFLSSICLILIQKPFSSFRTNKTILYRLIKYTVYLTLIRLFWLFGLTLCGPLRTILLYEHSDTVIITCFQVLFSSSNGFSGQTSRTRGAVFFILAVLAIFAFDNDDSRQTVDHPEGHSQHRIFAHIFYRFTSLIGVADHKGGVILLLITVFLRCTLNSFNKRLIHDVGEPKKFYALTNCLSTICLLSMFLLMYIFSDSDDSTRAILQTTIAPSLSWDLNFLLIIPLIFISICLFVSDFYVEEISQTKFNRSQTFRYRTYFMIVSSLIATFLWTKFISNENTFWFGRNSGQIGTEEHALSGGVIFAIVMFIFATDLLSSPVKQRSGAFIGYNQDGTPIFNLTQQKSPSVFVIFQSSLRDILAENDSRKIFYFLCINLIFTFVELLYGAWTNSLGLISDGFHMLFDCAALVVGLYAAVMTRWKPTRVFSYGYSRVEVLSGFVNGLFLIVIAFFVFDEAIGRLFQPPEINTNRLLAVSIAGFLVNMIGIFLFSHAHAHGASSNCSMSQSTVAKEEHHHGHHHSHDHQHSHSLTNNANMKDSAMTLLLQTPSYIQYDVLDRILKIEHILSYSNEHFWNLSSSNIIGTIHIQISNGGDEQYIRSEVQAILKDAHIENVAIQVEKQIFFNHLAGLDSALGQLTSTKRTFSHV